MDDFLHFKRVFTFGIALLHLIAIIPLQTSEIHRKALIAVLQVLSVIRCMNNIKTTFSPALQEATGKIEYGLTNDYMFRVLFQKNKKALTGLVCSLLHLNPEEITSIEITNPVEIGSSFSDKEFRLDIRLILNSHQQIDLEMQVNDYHDWPERSIGYLCRMYDSLEHGEEYINAKPAIHIGILDYTPFPEHPLFYSKNQIMDINTHRIYSDKFSLYVLDLSQIDLATKEDCFWQIEEWAKLFKATTWEEIKMIADKNEYLTETSNTLCDLYADRNIRERCLDRIEYNLRMKRYEDAIKEKDATIKELVAENAKALEEKDALIRKLMEENAKLKQQK